MKGETNYYPIIKSTIWSDILFVFYAFGYTEHTNKLTVGIILFSSSLLKLGTTQVELSSRSTHFGHDLKI